MMWWPMLLCPKLLWPWWLRPKLLLPKRALMEMPATAGCVARARAAAITMAEMIRFLSIFRSFPSGARGPFTRPTGRIIAFSNL